jgi:hypothetical protein
VHNLYTQVEKEPEECKRPDLRREVYAENKWNALHSSRLPHSYTISNPALTPQSESESLYD